MDEERNGLGSINGNQQGHEILVTYNMRGKSCDGGESVSRESSVSEKRKKKNIVYPSHIKLINHARIEPPLPRSTRTSLSPSSPSPSPSSPSSSSSFSSLSMMEIEVWEYIHEEEEEEEQDEREIKETFATCHQELTRHVALSTWKTLMRSGEKF